MAEKRKRERFKLKARNITKEDENKLYKKYKKVFKKNLEQEDLTNAICLLFLDLIYQYFDNKQPREKFKGNYSIVSIVKARIRKLGFIWRPIITAVQFKRQMERVFE
jgi:hypothetical protein